MKGVNCIFNAFWPVLSTFFVTFLAFLSSKRTLYYANMPYGAPTGEENILCFPSLSTYLFFLALSLKKIYWSIADLQCCVSFKGTAKWFHYTCTYIFIIFQILFPYSLLQNIEYSSLCYTVGPCWLFTLYIVVCVFQSQAPNLSLPFPPPYTFPVW